MHNHRPIFQRQLIVALVTNKLRAILDFFYTDRTFYRPVPYPMHQKNVFTKKPLNYYSLNVTEFHGDGVKNESTRAKKLEWLCPTPPTPNLFRVKFAKYL